MLNELIERIEVYHAEKIDGVHQQKLTIHYNCIGSIEISKILPLPFPGAIHKQHRVIAAVQIKV